MSDVAVLVLSALAGVALSAFFFGGLWWTVRRVATADRPVGLLLGSFVVRTCVALAGFYLVSAADWRRLLACFAGFLLTRLILVRTVKLGIPASQGSLT